MVNIEYANEIARTARAIACKIFLKKVINHLDESHTFPFLYKMKAYLREADRVQPSLIFLQFRYHYLLIWR